MVTTLGGKMATRVAASLLRAAGLPDLVCAGLAEYEDLAVSLATDGARHAPAERKRSSRLLLRGDDDAGRPDACKEPAVVSRRTRRRFLDPRSETRNDPSSIASWPQGARRQRWA